VSRKRKQQYKELINNACALWDLFRRNILYVLQRGTAIVSSNSLSQLN